MKNKIISAIKAAWYAAYEPVRLAVERGSMCELDYAACIGPDDEPIIKNRLIGDFLISVYCPTYNRADILLRS